MRAADRPLPPIHLHDDAQLARWPLRPVVAIQSNRLVAEWDDPDLIYDEDLALTTSARVGKAMVGFARVGDAS